MINAPCGCPFITLYERPDSTVTPMMVASKQVIEGPKIPAALNCVIHGLVDITDEEYAAIKEYFDGVQPV